MPSKINKCGRKPIFTMRREYCLKKICLENRFSTTKQINLSKMNFKAHRSARKLQLTLAMVAKSLALAKDHKDRDLDFWKSVNII